MRGGSGLAAVAALREKHGMARNDAGFTVDDYAKQFGLGYAAAKKEIGRLEAAGELVRGRSRRMDRAGQTRQVNVYRMK